MTPTHFKSYADRTPGCGIAIVCGKISGNLEMLELEGRLVHDTVRMSRLWSTLVDTDLEETWLLLNEGLCVESPSGGVHFFYRIADHEVPGNTKIARRPPTPEELAENPKDKFKVLIETRGEGGFVVAAPSGGTVHPTGKEWRIIGGDPTTIPTITWEQRSKLLDAWAAMLDEMPAPQVVPPVTPAQPAPTQAGMLRVGDDFNQRASWADILEPHGWQVSHVHGAETFWTRPGKNVRDGHSASTGYVAGQDRLFVWSSATDFETETPYNKFAAYALLEHNGNFVAATRELGRQGFGESRRYAPASGPDTDNFEWRPTFFTPPVPPSAPAAPPGAPERPVLQVQPSRYRNTSVGNAERLVAQSAHDFRYLPASKEWYVWDGRKWRLDLGTAQLNQATIKMTNAIEDEARKLLDSGDTDKQGIGKALLKWSETSQMDRGMKGTMSQFAQRPEVVAAPEDFDATPGLLNLPNGVYDLDNHVLLAPDRKYMATQVFGAAYEPEAKCPRFEKLIETLIPDEQMRRFVQRSVGYTLLGRPNQRALFITHGPKRTGKSQFHNILSALFGEYAGTAQPGSFHKVEKRGDGATPGLHDLRNKRFVTTSEESEHAVLDTESLKRLTGSEAIKTRTLYEKGQKWKPQMVLWIATNPLPQLNSDDDAIWDRVKPVPFTTRFTARGDEGTIKETPDIAEQIFAEEGSGIFNWALEGLKEFQRVGGLDQPEQIEHNVADYRHETDPVSQWWSEMVELGQAKPDPEASCDAKVLYQGYVRWCTDGNVYAVAARRFNSRLRGITGSTGFTKSNGRYLLPGWQWTMRFGALGSF